MLAFSNNDDIAEVTDSDIDVFESKFGISLPEDYRAFLRDVRGGYPSRDWAPFEGDGDYISHIFGLKSAVTWKAIDYGIDAFGAPSATGFLPVAICNGGNYFLLKINEPNRGAVFFWDHDEEDFEPPTFEFLTRVVSSFDKFMAKLEPPPNNG
jgi:SMI1-KNR4 cell-wall